MSTEPGQLHLVGIEDAPEQEIKSEQDTVRHNGSADRAPTGHPTDRRRSAVESDGELTTTV
jgi:hypothetical protein